MDGNGRWARARNRPRTYGHKKGVDTTSQVVESCVKRGIPSLTLFAFSSENWSRPEEEVSTLMELFMIALNREVAKLKKNGVRIRFIGDISAFSPKLVEAIHQSEELTRENSRLNLQIAVNYGGRWDIAEATRKLATQVASGEIEPGDITIDSLSEQLSTADIPDPDLFIRTGGEHRISNFLLWQLAYTELFFTDVYWPDFSEEIFDEALASFAGRERRFGKTGEQVTEQKHA